MLFRMVYTTFPYDNGNPWHGGTFWSDHENNEKSRTCRARFPADQGCLYATAKTLPVGSHSSFRLKPSRSSGAPSAPAAFGGSRASRGGRASLGLAELRGWLIRYLFEMRPDRHTSGPSQTYQVVYKTVRHLISSRGAAIRLAHFCLCQIDFLGSAPARGQARQGRQGRQGIVPRFARPG